MTNKSMAATFSRKPLPSNGLDHPEQLFTPKGSDMFEKLETGTTVWAYRKRGNADAALYYAIVDHCAASGF